ncbi:MAG: tRNA lysidine(34) synthetase TilS [Bacteroidota bacterium]
MNDLSVKLMLRKIQKILERNPHKHYVLACSAGVDSMVMLETFYRLKLPCSVIHVDYGLRGKESTEDARFLKERCNALNIPCFILRSNLKKQLGEKGGNLQQEARKIRYAFLAEILGKIPGSIGVTAHHQDDQLETFWLHLIRGSGLSGLSGMEHVSDQILRPFLSVSRASIEQFANKNNILWREDQSNKNNQYLRNRLRNEALPILYQEHPTLRKELLLLMKKFQQTHRLNRVKAQKLARQWRNLGKIPHIDMALESTVIVEALKQLGIEPRFLNQVLELSKLATGKQVLIHDKLRLIQGKNGLVIITHEFSERFRFSQGKTHKLPFKFDAWTWYLNPEDLLAPLKLARYSAHETMRPNGLRKEKTINAILKSAGIPQHERDRWPVLKSGSSIVGIPGIALSHAYRANLRGTIFIKITFVPC